MNHKLITRSALALSLFAAGFGAHAANLGQNLIVNGNAEGGVAGWTAFAGVDLFQSVAYGSNWVLPTQPGPVDRGSYLFAGQASPASAGFQLFDVSNLSSLIATGGASFTLDGYLGGWTNQGDNALVYVSFLDGANTEIGSATLGPVTPADRGNQTGLLYRQTQGFLPVGTTTINLSLSMERLNSSDNDGYADNLSFVINTAPVPEPETYALMGLGLGLLAVVRRRKSI
ncbi:MAG: hypothetical protein CFE41_06210 [Burkholderiales bacterium PBB2]|nr:MAG: hypothetical protein CFE41_06210 [Burkholderiales bacterium PBB2]